MPPKQLFSWIVQLCIWILAAGCLWWLWLCLCFDQMTVWSRSTARGGHTSHSSPTRPAERRKIPTSQKQHNCPEIRRSPALHRFTTFTTSGSVMFVRSTLLLWPLISWCFLRIWEGTLTFPLKLPNEYRTDCVALLSSGT